ncbi:MAG: hypothetical protein LBR26_16070 [Prevotella sp.]|jgi:uncharacterized protein (TIGR02145 family)|nr:hypothetical protein [Prevotella sp.]
MKKIELNGLIWDDKNLILNDKNLLNWEAAMICPKSDGWRLPTQEEWQALADLGSTWDEENQGRWFGTDSELLGDSEKSIFLPADGYRSADGTLHDAGYYGNYWSASPYNGSYAYNLTFYSGGAYPAYANHRTFGFSVRLVKDIR